jgi:hypothetical protein
VDATSTRSTAAMRSMPNRGRSPVGALLLTRCFPSTID